ncbi:MAG: hypothetical protein KF858_10560, partial [Candidatus Sumerlaeia bacterium]|nr:hypothetical protein [Candidatus Sumerlaeia bacterium]
TALLATGCARLEVTSQPADARVVWSPTADEGDWRPWPPRAWDASAVSTGVVTPLKSRGRYGDAIWIRVEKDGYFAPLPQPVQLYMFRDEKVHFDLKETPATYASRMQAQGLVLWRGEWVRPQDHNLVEHRGVWMLADEAEALEMTAKGLVRYGGEWLTREEYGRRFAADQLAAGLVLHKDRWVSPEVKAAEEAVDARVANVRSNQSNPLEAPKVIGRIDSSDSELQVVNSTSRTARVLFSGPQSRELLVEPYQTYTRLFLPAGRYEIVAQPATEAPSVLPSESQDPREQSIIPQLIQREGRMVPFYVEHPLAGGYKYLLTYDGGLTVDFGRAEDYRIPTPTLPSDLPTIEVPEVDLPDRRPQPGQRPGGGAPGGGMRGGGAPGGGGGAPRR